jgi:hypothetical protein
MLAFIAVFILGYALGGLVVIRTQQHQQQRAANARLKRSIHEHALESALQRLYNEPEPGQASRQDNQALTFVPPQPTKRKPGRPRKTPVAEREPTVLTRQRGKVRVH